MKKLLAFLATALVAACLLGAAAVSTGGFQVNDVTSVRATGNEAYISPVETDNAAVIAAVKNMLSGSAKAAKPTGASEIFQLTLRSSQGTEQVFQILYANGSLYARQGEKVRSVGAEEFFGLVNNVLGPQLYRYQAAAKPQITGAAGGESQVLEPVSGAYSYRKLDGQYYQQDLPAGSRNLAAIVLEEGQWPGLSWSGGDWAAPVDQLAVTIAREGTTVHSGNWDSCKSYFPAQGGVHQVQLMATYNSDYYRGELTYEFEVDYKRKAEISFTAEGSSTYPGELVVLKAYNIPEGQTIGFDSDIQVIPNFFDLGNGEWICLFPVSYFTTVGEHYVELSSSGAKQRFGITVNDKQFQIQNLTASTETTEETINSQKANAEYEEVIAPLRPVTENRQYWNGKFVMPVSDHNVTTQFGMIRYVNGAPTSSRHGALDLAVPRGTPVAATNSGKVLYAGYLQLTGYTVLIEHGYGLKSWYYHMDSINVETGDVVEKSQKIGEVGSTGFSTGPHLHFGLSVNNVFINPYTIIKTDLLPE